MGIIRLPLLVNTLERRDDRYLEGRAMSYSKIEQEGICQYATGNPPFLVRFTMRIDRTVLEGLGHFFPIGFFPSLAGTVSCALDLYLVVRSSASST